MISFNCMVARGLDRRLWVLGDCVTASSPEDAASRYCRSIWESDPGNIEHDVPMLIRVVDDEDKPHEFHVVPKFTVKFDVEPWAQN